MPGNSVQDSFSVKLTRVYHKNRDKGWTRFFLIKNSKLQNSWIDARFKHNLQRKHDLQMKTNLSFLYLTYYF